MASKMSLSFWLLKTIDKVRYVVYDNHITICGGEYFG